MKQEKSNELKSYCRKLLLIFVYKFHRQYVDRYIIYLSIFFCFKQKSDSYVEKVGVNEVFKKCLVS